MEYFIIVLLKVDKLLIGPKLKEVKALPQGRGYLHRLMAVFFSLSLNSEDAIVHFYNYKIRGGLISKSLIS